MSSQISHLPATVLALLLHAAQPVSLGVAMAATSLLAAQEPGQAQSAETVGRVAKAITVRIEGATQGSGVLVKREGNRYTVLTAWHVVRSQGEREELDIFTPDGKRHSVEKGSIQQIRGVDMAVLSFSSSNSYEVASIGSTRSISMGSPIFVAGFPLATKAVNASILRFLKGDVIANASVAIKNGYQLLYSNPTLPGMSGGAVLNIRGQLVGVHGQGETDIKMSEQRGIAIKTGTNQAVPILYYNKYLSGATIAASSAQASTADDYLVQADSLYKRGGSKQELIRLSSRILAIKPSAVAYFYRADAKHSLGDSRGAIEDYTSSIRINPRYVAAYGNRGTAKADIGDIRGSISDYNKAISIAPEVAMLYHNRGLSKYELGDNRGAIDDYSKAISIDPRYFNAYYNRGIAFTSLGDYRASLVDYDRALAINPESASALQNRGNSKYELGDKWGALADYSQAISVNPRHAGYYHSRGLVKLDLGNKWDAIADLNQAIIINPSDSGTWALRGIAKSQVGDQHGACLDMRKSVYLGSSLGKNLLGQVCQ